MTEFEGAHFMVRNDEVRRLTPSPTKSANQARQFSFLAFLTVILLAACGTASSGQQNSTSTELTLPKLEPQTTLTAPVTQLASTSTATVPAVVPATMTAADLAQTACATPIIRMDKTAELYTSGSWTCTLKNEHIRIDLYDSENQKSRADAVLIGFYKQAGDSRSLAELPLVCGANWSVGTDSNSTRDALITAFKGKGLVASTC